MQALSSVIKQIFVAMVAFSVISCINNYPTGYGSILSVDRSDFDFGIVPDSTSYVHHTFKLSNRSTDTCFVRFVSKGCGCIDIEMDTDTIPPGKTLDLRMKVDISGYFNHIEKPVYVYNSLTEKPLRLRILADRKPPVPDPISDYPYSQEGPLRFSSSILFAGYVAQGSVYDATCIVYNSSDKTERLRKTGKLPKHIHAEIPGKIGPHSIARLTVHFDFRDAIDSFGEVSEELKLQDRAGHIIELPLYAVVTEAFENESQFNPRIIVPVTAYTLIESDKDREVITRSFQIKNHGDADLIIRSIKLSSEDAEFEMNSSVIEAGDEAALTISIPKSSLREILTVNIICNDPLEPFKQLSIEP